MRKLVGLSLVVVGLVAPGTVQARGYGSGAVSTPFGSINTNSPAYRMSGGDPFAAMEIQQQMNMMKMQQQMMQQQMKLEQQFQQRMKSDPKFRKQVEEEQARMQAAYAAAQQPKKKKKRPTFNGTAAAKDGIKARNDDNATADVKPTKTTTGGELKSRRDDKTEAKPAK